MTNCEKWNLIVDEYPRLKDKPESEVQKAWEMYCAELFGYKKLLNEIDAQRHLSVGAGNAIIPDIILRINKQDVFDIELKQYSLSFNEHFETQLISYLNQTHISSGMIVCNRIYLYYYEYATISINKIEIPFEKDNADGIALIEMISKNAFSAKKIQEYIQTKLDQEETKAEIKALLNNEWVKNAVRSKLLETYSQNDVDEIICDFDFSATLKNVSSSVIPLPQINAAYKSGEPLFINDNIPNWILNWANKKVNSKEAFPFRTAYHTKKYTRITTWNIDQLIPYQEGARSGWNNGHFYCYEINYSNGKLKIYIVFSNKNTPKHIQETINKIFAVTKDYPKDKDWEWKRIFSTKSFKCSSITTEEDIYRELDLRFKHINSQVAILLKNLH